MNRNSPPPGGGEFRFIPARWLGRWALTGPAQVPAALDRDEPQQAAEAQQRRDPEVQAHAEDAVRVVDPQRLDEHAEPRVAGDVQREQARRLDLAMVAEPHEE